VKHFAALLVFVASGAVVAITGEQATDTSGHAAPAKYRITTLDSRGGANNRGNSINDLGLVSGYTDSLDGASRRATLWFLGHRFTLRTLGGPNSSVAWPVKNNIGLVVGIAQTADLQPRNAKWSCGAFFPAPDNTRFVCLGFVWEFGRMRRLPTFGGDNGFAAAANNRRQVVGWAETDFVDDTCDPDFQVLQFHAALWDLQRNVTHPLRPLGTDSSSAATAINDRGQVVGISGDCDQAVGRLSARNAVIWEKSVARKLDDLGGPAWNTPTAINQRGDIIAGFATLPGDNPDSPRLRAVAWTTRPGICPALPGTNICDLGMLPGHLTSQASGVNDRGQIVGTSCPAPPGLCRAFLFENGVMKDLNESKAHPFTDQLENAMDVNQFGVITGRAVNTDTRARSAIVMTPTRFGSSR
jgi:probable HAF family extracellular repeat protein